MSGGGGSPAPFSSPDPFAGQIFGSGAPLGGDLEGSGSAAGGPTDRCLSLRFTARLRSVNPDEVELVGVGDVLVVELFSADRPQIGAFRTLAEGSRLFRADQPVGVLLERLVELLP